MARLTPFLVADHPRLPLPTVRGLPQCPATAGLGDLDIDRAWRRQCSPIRRPRPVGYRSVRLGGGAKLRRDGLRRAEVITSAHSNPQPPRRGGAIDMAATYRLSAPRRFVNTIVTPLARLGLAGRHTYILTVRGRKTARSYSTPVRLIENGERWLVAPLRRGRLGTQRTRRRRGGAAARETIGDASHRAGGTRARGTGPTEVPRAGAGRTPVLRRRPRRAAGGVRGRGTAPSGLPPDRGATARHESPATASPITRDPSTTRRRIRQPREGPQTSVFLSRITGRSRMRRPAGSTILPSCSAHRQRHPHQSVPAPAGEGCLSR